MIGIARRMPDLIKLEAQLKNTTGLILTGCRLKSDALLGTRRGSPAAATAKLFR